MGNIVTAKCDICGSSSNFDLETLKGSTHKVNGIKKVICCPCEDSMFQIFLNARISKKRMMDLTDHLMMDERAEIMELYKR